MIKQLLFATRNQYKYMELLKKVAPYGISLVSLDNLNTTLLLEETGDTLVNNAFQKAEKVYEYYGQNCIADDSGLEVDALSGAPGVYSARYAGDHRSDVDNNFKLLSALEGIEDRSARFRACIVLILEGTSYLFEGVCEGEITKDIQGEQGFGYDSLFKPLGFSNTFAQMSLEEKNVLSHRGKAVEKLLTFILSLS